MPPAGCTGNAFAAALARASQANAVAESQRCGPGRRRRSAVSLPSPSFSGAWKRQPLGERILREHARRPWRSASQLVELGPRGCLAGLELARAPAAISCDDLLAARAVLGLGTGMIGGVSWMLPSIAVLRRVVEERRQRVELLLRDRVELVVVADRAAGGQAEPDLRDGLGAVAGVEDEVLLGDRAALVGRDVAAVEAGGDLLVERAVRAAGRRRAARW